MSPHVHQRSTHPSQGQRGAFIITTALLLLFLLGFMGIALDFGRMFVVRGELQTALDACALSAAAELDGSSTATTRAIASGMAAGNANAVNLQSANWSGQGQIVDTDISFRDASYTATANPALARYAQCSHTHSNIGLWLLRALNASSGSALVPATGTVATSAVATRTPAQTSCPIPVAFKPDAGATAPDYGLTVGQWVKLINGTPTGGNVGWANLDGSNSASETVNELNGYCGTEIGDTLGTPGVQSAVTDVWNERFGIYKNSGDPSVQRPDYTGYSYTQESWGIDPARGEPFNAYSGSRGVGADASAQNFVTKRAAFASCGNTSTQIKDCEDITGLKLNSFKKLAPPGNTTGGHKQYGHDRRVVLVPVIDGGNRAVGFLCMLMLQPLEQPMGDVNLEYLGNASTLGSPCTTSGLAGGTLGPLVPVLVR
jgi:Flp pilus assembly protein TadG